MPEQGTSSGHENEGFEGGRYARSGRELYEKAVDLLDKCKVEERGQDDAQGGAQSEAQGDARAGTRGKRLWRRSGAGD